MIKSLTLTNYRCFKKHEVTFRDMNIIVGANNAGKSTLVESMRLLSLVVNKHQGLSYNRPPSWTDLSARFAGVSPALGDIDLRGGSVFYRYGDPPAVISAEFPNGNSVEVYVGPKNQAFGLIRDSRGRIVDSKSRARDIDLPRIAILPQIGPLLESEPFLSWEHVSRSMETGLASRHFRNQMYGLKSEYFDAFKARAESSWPHLRIESLNREGTRPDESLSLHVRDRAFVAEVGWMGHGLQMWLQTMWFLARSADAETVILDEPDVYMHADLQRRLIRLLRNRLGQTVVATHSVEIMSEVSPEDILVVDKERRRSSFAVSLPAVQHAIDRMGGVHNIHLARLWGSQRCLHVEGKDIVLLKAMQDILYPQSDSSFDVIPRLSIGGWSGWDYAIGSAMSLRNAAGEDIVAYCILDSDYHTEEERSQRHQKAASCNVQLHIWDRKEIENYLLVPSAIARLIAGSMPDGRKGPTTEAVHSKIDEIASELRDSVFDALSHEYLTSDRSGGVPRANQRARQKLDRAWRTIEGRYGIISGKQVITRLSEWSKQKFGVSFGPLRIAKEMRPNEVPAEMKTVIQSIEHLTSFAAPVGGASGGK